MKQLATSTLSGKLPEMILLNVLRLPRRVWFILGGLGLLAFIASLTIVPDLTVYALTAVGAGIPLLLLLWHRPDLGLVGVIFLASGLIPAELAEIRLPIGGLELRDVAFMGLLGLVVFQGLVRKSLPIPWTPVGVPLLIFLLLAVFSLFNALVFENVATNWAFNDMRILIYYGMFFMTAWSIKRRLHLNIVLATLFLVANMIAIAIILQQFLGESSYVLSAMSGGRWRIHDIGTMVRVVPAAHALMHFMAVIAFTLILFTRHNLKLRLLYLLQFLFLTVSLLLTFTRSQWLATAIAILLMIVVLIPHYKDQVIQFSLRFGIPLLLLLVSVVGFGGASLQRTLNDIPIVSGIIERASTIFTPDETLETSSLEWREFEFEESMRALRENPWLGVSLGNTYRETTTLQGEVLGWWTDGNLEAGEISRFTRFVHSSYVAIAVKMGVLGFAAFSWFCLAFLICGWRLFQRLPLDLPKGIVLAVVTSFIGLMQWSAFHTHFIRTESTIAIGVMVGIVGSIHRLTQEDTAAAASERHPRLNLAKVTSLFHKGSGFYGLLLFGVGLVVVLLMAEPVVRNQTAVSPPAINPATTNQLSAADSINIPTEPINASQKLNIIQPQDLQTFRPDESIFTSWIWPTKLQPEQEFVVVLLNNEQQFVLGTQSQVGSNNRYWLNTTIPIEITGGEYQLLIQLQNSANATATASSPPRIIYILDRPASPTPTHTPTPTSAVTSTPEIIHLPWVQIDVNSISLREGPGLQYGVIGYLYIDDVVQVIAKADFENDWYNVLLGDGSYGWIASRFTLPLDETVLTDIPIAATLPPLPTPSSTPIPATLVPTADDVQPQQNNHHNPNTLPSTFTPPPLPPP